MSDIERTLQGAVRDGMILGLSMAIDTLAAAKPSVDAENQTWDTAVAVLNITLAEYQAKAFSAAPGEAGE